ncbi:unnamed protein product [Angiostrongylus costaricensis]|uniref:protein-tyrosine-phosphatase n=1 Tax=Angiostrongylus costaricensis TaxID=334426 RepID=A0A0R3PGK1_ANGCS|nr:unnamed protein product [Angiostrongylus costaricensis]
MTFRGQTITVNHFAYLVWPDHTAPFNPAPMSGCMKLCRQLAESHPITVHCSAGIGRSATFIGKCSYISNCNMSPIFVIIANPADCTTASVLKVQYYSTVRSFDNIEILCSLLTKFYHIN